MAKNVFRKNMDYAPKLTRSSKDLSFDNNFTTKFGQISPLMWKFLNAGESISIDTNFAIQFKPTVFPVQTPIRATMHFFKVPIRLLYKDWEDFRYGNKTDLVLPYHAVDNPTSIKQMFKTGGLMDFLGVPSTYYGSGDYSLPEQRGASFKFSLLHNFLQSGQVPSFEDIASSYNLGLICPGQRFFTNRPVIAGSAVSYSLSGGDMLVGGELRFSRSLLPFRELGVLMSIPTTQVGVIICEYSTDGSLVNRRMYSLGRGLASESSFVLNDINSFVSSFSSSSEIGISFVYYRHQESGLDFVFDNFPYLVIGSISNGIDWVDLPDSDIIRLAGELSVSALPARAYEMCYNAFFRSNQNVDPFEIDGVAEPNKYLPTTDGGADYTVYDLHFRNWDDDFLTTAYKTPQQGPAPLVGITSVNANSLGSLNGVMQVDRGDGTNAEIGVKLDENGKVVELSNEDLSAESTRVRIDAIRAVTQGISINDFRDVSAYQVWLERNIRRGLKFVDQQLAHTGVKIKNRELDMPEFIGGYSRMVQVSKVNDTTSEGLGDYAGQLSLFDGSRHNITTFADQPCIVMGLMTIIPQASYSQLMPKFFSRRTAGDFFDPAFNKIGLQPITYREVCPVQCFIEGTKELDSTFGYQIPWYDDQCSVDEVHGQMRQITMRDRLINRTFSQTPELSKDFLRIDPEQVNDVFPDRNPEDDPICGQVHFTIYKKSQIYDMHVPGII